MRTISWLIPIPILAYGAWCDHKRREIPDIVPGALAILAAVELLLSVLMREGRLLFPDSISIGERIVGVMIPALVLLVSYMVREDGMGGGDFKLTLALGAVFGLTGLARIYFYSSIVSLVYIKIKKVNRVPFGTMAFIGYILSLLL